MTIQTTAITHARRLSTAALAALITSLAGPVEAQVIYSEDFQSHGSISSLQQAGWVFRNQTDIPNRLGWDINPSGGPVGTLWLEGSTWAGDGNLSTWAIMPAIAGQQGGMPMRFHALGSDTNPPRYDWLELRYSPSGGVGTGSDSDDVGDFTDILWRATPQDLGIWWNGPLEVTLPGNGRLAWRYGRNGPDESGLMGIDGIEIGEPNDVPFPDPGEVVHWTLDMSPIIIDADRTIVGGGTVVVDAGVEVEIATNKRLTVDGVLRGEGVNGQNVVIRGGNSGGLGISTGGEVELDFTEVACRVSEEGAAQFTLRDGVVRNGAGGFFGGRMALNVFERSTIEQDWFEPWGTVVLRDTELTGSTINLYHYTRFDNVTASAPIVFLVGSQDVFVDGVHITGVAGAPLVAKPGTWNNADVLLGDSNTLTGNGYPLELRGPGVHPASTIPASGNSNNAVLVSDAGGGLRYNHMTWPNLGMPYHILEQVFVQGAVDVEPGVRFLAGPEAYLDIYATQSDYRFRGTPDQPLVFDELFPGQGWLGISIDGGDNLFEHVHVSNAEHAIFAVQGIQRVNESVLRGNGVAVDPSLGYFEVRGTRFYDNAIGAEEAPSPIFVGLDLNGYTRPNIFEGNDLAVRGILGPNGEWKRIPAENNWWNASDGPGGELFGSGDPVTDNTDPYPFLQSRPDLSDTPPIVRLITRPYLYALPGDTLLLEWSVEDDGTVTEQRIVAQTALNEWITLLDGLTGDVRTAEIEAPANIMRVRIVAADDLGQESYEQFSLRTPREAPSGQVQFHTPIADGFTGGQEVSVCYDALNVTRGVLIFLELAGEERWVRGPSGSAGTGRCSFSTLRFPYISTDRARLAIDGSDGNNLEWYFSDPFEVRPHAGLGDAPPEIEMTSPVDGASFPGGSVVPITWTASDDSGLREFKIQYSTNGGYTWNTLRRRLPSDLRSFNWKLPASAGIDDLRVRVQAADLHFQASTDGDDHVLTVLPGDGCAADFNGDGTVNTQDVLSFLNAWTAGDGSADFNGDGDVNTQDVLAFLNAWTTGC